MLVRKSMNLFETSPKSYILLMITRVFEIVTLYELLDFSRTYFYDYLCKILGTNQAHIFSCELWHVPLLSKNRLLYGCIDTKTNPLMTGGQSECQDNKVL